jgi:molecular chaperone GrpE
MTDEPQATSEGNGEAPLDESAARVADLNDRLLRARADSDKLQKRVLRDAEIERERARARVIERFVPIYEMGQLALAEASKAPGPIADGVRMVMAEFERAMRAEGLQPFGAAGEAFDAARHEAIGEEAGPHEPGTIARVVQPGYLLGSRVLRYAKVVVTSEDSEE